MQQTTKVMFAYYKARRHALDVLCGDFGQAMIKPYSMYSGDVVDILQRQQEYPSPLFDSAEEH